MVKTIKFKWHQVVAVNDGSFCKLVMPAEVGKTSEEGLFGHDGNVYVIGGKEPWYHVSELRPLTKSEISGE